MQSSIKPIIIAIDGFSSCGKSTFAKTIASRLGYTFIDTGAMYRAVALCAVRAGAITDDVVDSKKVVGMLPSLEVSFKYNPARGASDVYVGDERVEDLIRKVEISEVVSRISSISQVRDKLVSLQQLMGQEGGVVMDGRDIGTVVFPSAQIKIYMTAEPKIRAQRRYDELTAKGESVSFDEIENNIISRDRADMTREISPLRRAEDAVLLDNSHMSLEEQMEWFYKLYNEKCNDSRD